VPFFPQMEFSQWRPLNPTAHLQLSFRSSLTHTPPFSHVSWAQFWHRDPVNPDAQLQNGVPGLGMKQVPPL
jgi:hypothetical protein